MRTTPCRSCKKLITFAKTVRGRWLPLDAGPAPLGEFVLIDEEGAGTYTATHVSTLSEIEAVGFRERYQPHWKTCPNAKAHRRVA